MVLPRFGQVVIGPPGSGKTTYCDGMSQLLSALGRPCAVVNIDPANERTPFRADVDVQELVRLEDVMEETGLGPNGGLVYCMEFLEKNFEWLSTRLDKLPKDAYVLIDCPGQVELYTHHNAVRNILKKLEKAEGDYPGMRLCAVNLVDSHHCSDPAKFVSVCLVTLNSMLQMELPQVNVLSKVDLIEKYGRLHFNVDFYTEVLDLKYLTDAISDDPFLARHKKLNEAVTELVENYGLVSFVPLNVSSKDRLLGVLSAVDKANGYCFSGGDGATMRSLASSAVGGAQFEYARTGAIREEFMDLDAGGGGGEVGEIRERLWNDLDKVDINPGFQV